MAWLPIPLLLAVIAGLWVADLRTAYESRTLMTLLNFFFTWLASLCICLLAARGFLVSGQPGLLMFGCGSLLWGVTSLSAALVLDRLNTTITVHNVGVFGAALCHLVGLLWRGHLHRPGRWLVAGYTGALLASALLFWAAAMGVTPLFFVQGQGGTWIREVVLVSAITMFAWVAHQMVYKFWRQSGAFCYWYGLGLALVATGLTGVALLTVQGSILGWANRITQYLGSAYLFIAAVVAAGETGCQLSLSAMEEAWLRNELLPSIESKRNLRAALRYGSAVLAVAVSWGVQMVITARFGPGFPFYILFAPTMLAVAIFAGFWPGALATLLADLVVDYRFLPPIGEFAIASPIDRLGLLVFTGAALFCCAFIELYRRARDKAAAFDREVAVRESRERLAMFAEATFEGIVESEAGRIVDCNEQYARMLGYTVAELRGMEIGRLIPSEDRERVMENIWQNRDSVGEHEMLRKDGTRIVVEAHGRPVSAGSKKRYTAVRDITERKRAEEELTETKAILQAAMDNSQAGIAIADAPDGKLRYVNKAGLFIRGKGEEVVIGVDINKYVSSWQLLDFDETPLQPDEVPLARAIKYGEKCGREFMIRRSDNDDRIVWANASPILDSNGRVKAAVVVFLDITERKRAEEALRKNEERHRLLAETMLQGVVHQAADGKIISMNPAAERILGKSREQFLGSSSVKEEHDTILPDGSPFPGVDHPTMVALRTGQNQRGVIMGVYNPILNDYRWIKIDAVPLFHPGDSSPFEVYSVFEDITERKRAEEA